MDALFDAISNGNRAAVERLLDSDASLLDAERGGTTALLFALYTGQPHLVRAFRERGRKLRFHEACALGETAEVEQMLQVDSGILQTRSPDGFTPVALAIFFRRPSMARLLIERGGDIHGQATNPQRVAPVHAAAAVCDRDSMELLLTRGADPNVRQQGDFTPLHGAATHGDIAMAELLLAHGAAADARTAEGMTVAEAARKHGKDEFAVWFEARIT